jgi:hypothetical protein
MGKYIDWADVTYRYKRFADVKDANEAADEIIPYAENYVEMGLASHFSVPFSSNNTTVKDLSIDVSMAKILMFKDSEKANMMLSHVNSIMSGLREGVLSMLTSSGDVIGQKGEPVYSKTMNYEPVFGHGDIEDFKVDSQQLYDEHINREY